MFKIIKILVLVVITQTIYDILKEHRHEFITAYKERLNRPK